MVIENFNGHNVQYYTALNPVPLECGRTLSNIQVAYHTWGKLNPNKNNVIWICHALTANSDAEDWWPGMIGEGFLFDPTRDYIICANVIGSCYGTTGPLSINPNTEKPYYRSFPEVTVRDMIAVHEQLRVYLKIDKINVLVGGSIGAHQALEWAIINPEIFENLVFAASGAHTTPWAIALNEAQRMAIEADPSYFEDRPDGGDNGLRAARAMALTSYRNYTAYNKTQYEDTNDKLNDYRASSYQRYQGDKLVKRFNAYAYYRLSQAIDSFNVGRNRNGVEDALAQIKARTLVIGISTDCLFPTCEQKYVAKNISGAIYKEINSDFGHDGFLIEHEKLTAAIGEFLN
ncbi:MAG: homoserine O-acetyltransferase [Prevotellaceae bacterium]|jgi:homoserine O-acetyltransferase|nr:homoserine O-acetyltransferase [Prevotellaceae bacterium]